MTISDEIAEFALGATYEQLSTQAVTRVVDAFTDFVGVALAGRREAIAEILAARAMAPGPAYCLAGPAHVSLGSAALFNGSVGHALDYDDTSHPAYSHPSAHLVPPILAAAARHPLSGRAAVVAYAVGHETEAALAHAMNLEHYERGWHATGTLGAVSSVVTAGRVLGLDRQQLTTALGVGASMASGLRVNFGSMSKPLSAGLAARSGVEAAELAANGFTSGADGIGGRFGFLDVLGPQRSAARWQQGKRLGQPWELDSPIGLALKPYPSCGSTHCAAEAAVRLHPQVAGRAVRRVRVGANRLWEQVLVFHVPESPLQAKFSMEYCVAAALSRGGLTLADFTEQSIWDSEVRRLMARTEVTIDPRVRDNLEHGAVVTVELEDGTRLEDMVAMATGKPARWMSEAQLWGKFSECARGTLQPVDSERLFAVLQRLPELTDLHSALATASSTLVGG